MKKKRIVTLLAAAALLLALGYGLMGDPRIWLNNRRLARSIQNISTDMVSFNKIVPFEWDRVYDLGKNPGPYAGREDIEKVIGFRSRDIEENQISEGMLHLLFVKDQKVVACVLGYPSNLGYNIEMGDEVLSSEENIWLRVAQNQGVTWLGSNPEP